jgi:murein DD-endopeptidase MepM/ murein hydrolase activator NlpD
VGTLSAVAAVVLTLVTAGVALAGFTTPSEAGSATTAGALTLDSPGDDMVEPVRSGADLVALSPEATIRLNAERDRQDRASRARARAAISRAKLAAAQRRKEILARRPHWVLPVLHYLLTAGFGENGNLWSNGHTGQDFAADYGDTVRSIGDGTIIFADWAGPYGRKIEVLHTDGTVSWYCHLAQFNRISGKVTAGTVIGEVGSSGNSTGSHLHVEIHPDGGDAVDPKLWLASHKVNI